ncbi:hypothetical protein O181_010100 [Austropuccinia psidii MF-1]|uniref:Uncharacterized protein n=1 Tax=Austropuccinia psidii MF-1 TaxID=1389203 RepID=A0A9Q3BT84_9BASI|nr:hypothetical protein [Austropuccinia psidii MF-1]
MHRVDEEIEKASTNEGKRSQAHIHIESETATPTAFGCVPKGLPIDFLEPQWFNNYSPSKKTSFANIMRIAFLPDALQSICGKQNPDEKLGDKEFKDNDSSSNSEDFDGYSSLDSESFSSKDNDNEEEESDEDSNMQNCQEL